MDALVGTVALLVDREPATLHAENGDDGRLRRLRADLGDRDRGASGPSPTARRSAPLIVQLGPFAQVDWHCWSVPSADACS